MGKFKQPFLAALYLTGIMLTIWHLSEGISYTWKLTNQWFEYRALTSEYAAIIKREEELTARLAELEQYQAGYAVGSTTGPVTCAGAGCTQYEVNKIVSCDGGGGGCITYDSTGVTFASPTFVTPTLTNPDTGTITSGTLTMSGGTGTTSTLPSSGSTSTTYTWVAGGSGLALDDDGWPNEKDCPWDKVKEARVCK